MNAAASRPSPITVSSKDHYSSKPTMKFGDIVEVRGFRERPTFNIVLNEKDGDGEITYSMRQLNVSRFKFIRDIQIKVLKFLLNTNRQ